MRVEMIGDCTLYLGDCLDVLPTLGQVDAVVTDPPYGLQFRGNDWDAFIPLWLGQARRIAKSVLFTTAPTTVWNYPQADWVACWYRTAAMSRTVQGGFNHWTPILMYGQVKFTVDTFYSNGNVTAKQNEGIAHPSPKDLSMTRWLVESSTELGATVLDPFMGSGTTGVACVKTGRKFIGIEIDEGYYSIAVKRITEAYQQPRLPFSETSEQATQPPFLCLP